VPRAEDALLGFCRRVVELHKGSLEVRGARVSFTIPFPVVAGTPVKRAAVEDATVPIQALGLGLGLGSGGGGIGDGQVGLLLKTDAPLSFSLPGASTPFASAAAPAWGLSLSLSSDSTSMAPAPPLFNLADMQPLAVAPTPAFELAGHGAADREQHHHEEHKTDVEAGVPNLLDFSADWSQQFLRGP